jgi:hypothetical protein
MSASPRGKVQQQSAGPHFSSSLNRHDVAALGFLIEMQRNAPGIEVTKHRLDTLLDRRMVRAVAGHEFLDNGPQCRGRQSCVRDVHGNRRSQRLTEATVLYRPAIPIRWPAVHTELQVSCLSVWPVIIDYAPASPSTTGFNQIALAESNALTRLIVVAILSRSERKQAGSQVDHEAKQSRHEDERDDRGNQ